MSATPYIARGTRPTRAAPQTALLVCALSLLAQRAVAQDASTTLYVRTDSDSTTVITPRLHVGSPVGESTQLDLTYSVDVWTSASVDIRASASQAITEQRDEINAGVGQELGDVTVNASYRYSTEPDYQSNGGSLGVSYDFAENSATLGAGVSAFFDDVGRAGDPGFAEELSTVSARASFTQLLDRDTILQLNYELGRSSGYTASPYRFVGIATNDGLCGVPNANYYCLREQTPGVRMRHAIAVGLRRALSDAISLGGRYRFYLDDWELTSHTAEIDLAWLAGEHTDLRLRYRFYLQSGAAAYHPRYASLMSLGRYFTHDKELSPFSSHRLGAELEQRFSLDDAGDVLRMVLAVGPTFYLYSDFPPISQLTAFEATLSMVLDL